MMPNSFLRRYLLGEAPAASDAGEGNATGESPMLLELTRLLLAVFKSRRIRLEGSEGSVRVDAEQTRKIGKA